MNLHQIVRSAISSVNPDVLVTVKVSRGYQTLGNGIQRPQYEVLENVPVQIQALSAREVEHLDAHPDGLNIQGVTRAFYFNGNIAGFNRRAGKGGDLIVMPDGDVYRVIYILETWDQAGWCKVVGLLQTDGAQC